jgi:hypothetical protein
MSDHGRAGRFWRKIDIVETLIPAWCQEETLAVQASGILELSCRMPRNGWE